MIGLGLQMVRRNGRERSMVRGEVHRKRRMHGVGRDKPPSRSFLYLGRPR